MPKEYLPLLSKILKVLSLPIVLCLKIIRRIKGIDDSFQIYFPSKISRREILLWKLKVINPLIGKDVNFMATAQSAKPIDVYIPIAQKDILLLPQVITGLRLYISLNNIYVVCKPTAEIITICNECKVNIVDEIDVLGFDKNAIDYKIDGIDRAGWLYQQLLKLSADKIVESENFLVLDADTIFVCPKVFLYKQQTIYDMSEERHEPYHQVYYNLMNRPTTSSLSFISHYMLFNKTFLQKLRNNIELLHGKKWHEAILENVDYNDSSGFSEYELYGNFVESLSPQSVKKEYWFNFTSDNYPNYAKSISRHIYDQPGI